MSDRAEIDGRMHRMSSALARPLHAPMPPVSPPRPDMKALDRDFANRLRAECVSGDSEGDGSRADAILCELLRKLGMVDTAKVYEALDLWRA